MNIIARYYIVVKIYYIIFTMYYIYIMIKRVKLLAWWFSLVCPSPVEYYLQIDKSLEDVRYERIKLYY